MYRKSIIYNKPHFGHGIVQCSPTWTSNRIYSNPTHDKHQ